MIEPKISVIIVCYNMSREIVRTVKSFLPPYQIDILPGEVEVIVIDNGSPSPVRRDIIDGWPSDVKYMYIDDAHPSPAGALNHGIRISKSSVVCPVIDGARMASPGLLRAGLKALDYSDRTFVATIGFHLGDEIQQIAVQKGYCQQIEDQLLDRIDWFNSGYRLFEICAPGGSSRCAWFDTISESNAPILKKSLFEEIGGFEERFDFAGGGFVNLDFLTRAQSMEDVDYLLVLGEATFHQFHGGVTTSRHVQLPEEDGVTTYEKYNRQYASIRGERYSHPKRLPILFGEFHPHIAEISLRGLTNFISQTRK